MTLSISILQRAHPAVVEPVYLTPLGLTVRAIPAAGMPARRVPAVNMIQVLTVPMMLAASVAAVPMEPPMYITRLSQKVLLTVRTRWDSVN